jgi:hypothetical protein
MAELNHHRCKCFGAPVFVYVQQHHPISCNQGAHALIGFEWDKHYLPHLHVHTDHKYTDLLFKLSYPAWGAFKIIIFVLETMPKGSAGGET